MEIVNHNLTVADYNSNSQTTYLTDKEYEDSRVAHDIILGYIPNSIISIISIISQKTVICLVSIISLTEYNRSQCTTL